MKKTIATMLSFVMLLGLLTGCGTENTSVETGKPDRGDSIASQPQPQETEGGDDGLETVYVVNQRKRVDPSGYETVQNTMEYDQRGNLIKQGSDYNYTYEYDEQDRRIGWTRLRSDGSVHQKNRYEYDENGNEILQVEDYSEYHFEYASTYNDQGQLVEVVCTRNGEPFDTDTYTYDDQGRLAEYHDGTMYWYRYVYEGNTVTELSLNKNGTEDGSKEIRTYDDQGNLIREEFFEEGEAEYCKTYTYNDAGQLLESCKYDYDEGDRELDSKVVRIYDEQGRLTEKKHYDDDELEYSFVYEYAAIRVSPERARILRETNMDDFWE